MTTLTVWRFASPDGADRAAGILTRLARDNLGALTSMLTDVGISDDLIHRLRQDIVPGTSALFILSSDAVLDRVRTTFESEQPELMFTNLSDTEENRLRETFGVEHPEHHTRPV